MPEKMLESTPKNSKAEESFEDLGDLQREVVRIVWACAPVVSVDSQNSGTHVDVKDENQRNASSAPLATGPNDHSESPSMWKVALAIVLLFGRRPSFPHH
jgi:hypothetical protein